MAEYAPSKYISDLTFSAMIFFSIRNNFISTKFGILSHICIIFSFTNRTEDYAI